MERTNRLGYIDGLKGIAILAVTIAHAGGCSLPGVFGRMAEDGPRGVQLFLLISGMLTISSLNRFYADKKLSFRNATDWYLKKYVRLAPLFCIAVIFGLLLHTYEGNVYTDPDSINVWNVLAHFALIHGFIPHYINSILCIEWYVGVLWIYMLLSPLIYKAFNGLKRALLLLVAVVGVMAIVRAFQGFPDTEGWSDTDWIVYSAYQNNMGPLANVIPFLMGIVMFYIVFTWLEKKIMPSWKTKVISYVLLIVGVALLYIQNCGVQPLPLLTRNDTFSLWFCIIIISQAIHSSVLIDNPIFRFLGKYSYGIYLFQYVVVNFYDDKIDYHGPLSWCVKMTFCVVFLLLLSIVFTTVCDRSTALIKLKIKKFKN